MNRTDKLLVRLGILPNLIGYKYLRYGFALLKDDPERIQYVTKDLYPAIAHYYGTSWVSVEHAIRTAVTVCWERGNKELLVEMAGYSLKSKPTVSEFMAIIIGYAFWDNERI